MSLLAGFSIYYVPYCLVAAFTIWGEIYLIKNGKFKNSKGGK